MKVGALEMQGLDIWQINAMPNALALRVPLMAVVRIVGLLHKTTPHIYF